jgi:hypothetical protein
MRILAQRAPARMRIFPPLARSSLAISLLIACIVANAHAAYQQQCELCGIAQRECQGAGKRTEFFTASTPGFTWGCRRHGSTRRECDGNKYGLNAKACFAACRGAGKAGCCTYRALLASNKGGGMGCYFIEGTSAIDGIKLAYSGNADVRSMNVPCDPAVNPNCVCSGSACTWWKDKSCSGSSCAGAACPVGTYHAPRNPSCVCAGVSHLSYGGNSDCKSSFGGVPFCYVKHDAVCSDTNPQSAMKSLGYSYASSPCANCEPCASKIKCPAGKYQSRSVASCPCIDCPEGRYSADHGAGDCKRCLPGKVQPGTAQTSCRFCDTGKYQGAHGAQACMSCAAGKNAPPGSAKCTGFVCGAGQFLEGSGCETCPTGRFQYKSQHSDRSCTVCTAGRYQDETAQPICKPCEQGRYHDGIDRRFFPQKSSGGCADGQYMDAKCGCDGGSGYAECNGTYCCFPCPRCPSGKHHAPFLAAKWQRNTPQLRSHWEVVRTKHTWSEAQKYCQQHGADLVSLRTQEDLALAKTSLGPGQSIWVGINDRGKEGHFVNVDGTSPAGDIWRRGEPNNKRGKEDCAHWHEDNNGLNDDDCDKKLYFAVSTLRALRKFVAALDCCADHVLLLAGVFVAGLLPHK